MSDFILSLPTNGKFHSRLGCNNVIATYCCNVPNCVRTLGKSNDWECTPLFFPDRKSSVALQLRTSAQGTDRIRTTQQSSLTVQYVHAYYAQGMDKVIITEQTSLTVEYVQILVLYVLVL
jgi:uncharacterized protein (DUF1499 family)